ncbi:MAG: ABC transporter substrate-binding protein, partial [Alphaproteobacteria bacterium]
MKSLARLAAALLAVVALQAAAPAQVLRIGISSDTTSIDPHFAEIGTNIVVRQHVFDSLVDVGPAMELQPGLATSWRPTSDPLAWEIELRRGVRFHDGSPFTARDAVHSLRRAPDVPNAPSSYRR